MHDEGPGSQVLGKADGEKGGLARSRQDHGPVSALKPPTSCLLPEPAARNVSPSDPRKLPTLGRKRLL